tara:strand:+ start:1781 stop:2785 length:1005 start_codon:yes stop_codon:yes gene_type:complete
MTKDLKVSIIMLTYNHSDYIIEAIEGVLMQKTNFEFELIVSDDCSTDKTKSIVNEYLIQNNCRRVNFVSHNINLGINENFDYALNLIQGEYVALCDGDDYWTDPHKLQMQVDFMDRNENVSLICTERSIFIQKTQTITKYETESTGNIELYNFQEALSCAEVYTLTSLFRAQSLREYQKLRSVNKELNYLDYSLWIFLANKGFTAKIFKDTAMYRILENSATHSSDICNKWKLKKKYFSDFQILKNIVDSSNLEFINNQEYLRARSFFIFSVYCGDTEFINEFRTIFLKNKDYYRLYIFKLIQIIPIFCKLMFILQRAKSSLQYRLSGLKHLIH